MCRCCDLKAWPHCHKHLRTPCLLCCKTSMADNSRIEGPPHEAVADLHAFERWRVAIRLPAQAAEAVETQVQQWKMYWLNANTVKGTSLVHPVSWSSPLRKLRSHIVTSMQEVTHDADCTVSCMWHARWHSQQRAL